MVFEDIFGGDKLEKLSLKGIDNVIVGVVVESVIYLRVYHIHLKRSGTRVTSGFGALLDLHGCCDIIPTCFDLCLFIRYLMLC